MRLSMAWLAALLLAVSTSPRYTCEGFMLSPRMASFADDGVGGVLRRSKAQASDGLQGRGVGGNIPADSPALHVMMATSEMAAEDLSDKKHVPSKKSVAVGEFEAMDVRMGRITQADLVPDPDKGLKPSTDYLALVVDLGNNGERTLVSAVRPFLDVDDAVGKWVMLVANVEEETILGLPSRGRLLSTPDFDKDPLSGRAAVLRGGGGIVDMSSPLVDPVSVHLSVDRSQQHMFAEVNFARRGVRGGAAKLQAIVDRSDSILQPFCDFKLGTDISVEEKASSTVLIENGSIRNMEALRPLLREASFGAGNKTVLDPNVRSGYYVDLEEVRILGLAEIQREVAESIERLPMFESMNILTPRLSRLHVYLPGGKFLEHRDTVDGDGHIASVVINLVSAEQGGELRIGEDLLPRKNDGPGHLPAMCFFTDVPHSIEPVLEGVRASLQFDIAKDLSKADKVKVHTSSTEKRNDDDDDDCDDDDEDDCDIYEWFKSAGGKFSSREVDAGPGFRSPLFDDARAAYVEDLCAAAAEAVIAVDEKYVVIPLVYTYTQQQIFDGTLKDLDAAVWTGLRASAANVSLHPIMLTSTIDVANYVPEESQVDIGTFWFNEKHRAERRIDPGSAVVVLKEETNNFMTFYTQEGAAWTGNHGVHELQFYYLAAFVVGGE